MVSFPEEKSTDSKEIVQFLQDRIRDAANLGQKVSAMDRQESLSKEFQSKVSPFNMHVQKRELIEFTNRHM